MAGRSSQRKGRRAEIELAELLRDAGFPDVKTGDAVSYGRTPDLFGLPGVHVEVKRHERLELPAWLRQAVEDSEKFGDGLPCVVHRQNRQAWIVSMRLCDWLALFRKGMMNDDR